MYGIDKGYFKYGNEADEVEIKTYKKQFDSLERAIEYADRFTTGPYFCYYEIYDTETLDLVYRKNYTGDTEKF